MYKIIDTENDSFVLEVLDEKYKFEPALMQADIRHSGLGDFMKLLRRKLSDEYGNDFNYNEFRKEILKKSAICIYKLMKRKGIFECERQGFINRMDFFVYINNKLHKLNGCPSSFGLKDTCANSTCRACRLRAFKLIANIDDVKDKFKNQDKKVIVIDDYICGLEKQRLIDKFKIEENIKNKMCSFIDNDEIKILCPRYLYLKDKGCYQTGKNENECIECWKEAKRDYEEGEE